MKRHNRSSDQGGLRKRGATITGVVAALALGLSACGTEAGNGAEPTDPGEITTTVTTEPTNETSPPPAGTTTPATTPEEANDNDQANDNSDYLGDPDTAPQEQWPDGVPSLMVSNVRVAGHEGFDRVVFDLAGEGDPGWLTNYTENPVQQGSGNPIPYNGETSLMVGIQGTPYPFDLDMEFPDHGTYPGAGNVTEVTYASLFEARTEFVIGVTGEMPYSVTVLQDPKRLVIDFVHQ